MRLRNININFDASGYEASEEDRMFVYIWEDADDTNECKFGERWVKAGLDPVEDCADRVYASLGVRKDRARDGKINLVWVADVSDIAKKENRFAMQKRMDDFLREQIGFRKGATGEVHTLPAQEMKGRVADLLRKFNQPLIEAGLSTMQYNTAAEVIDSFQAGNRVILAELCARFGKTIWSAAIAVEENVELVIVASYVKTVFTSFANDLKTFKQFTDYVHVDAADPEYKAKVDSALANGQKVFVYLSLCNGGKRQERIDYLFSLDVSRMLIVDEADFGAHTVNQAMPLINKINGGDDRAIIMTGTNADRAVTFWEIDDIVSVTYPELLIQKKLASAA